MLYREQKIINLNNINNVIKFNIKINIQYQKNKKYFSLKLFDLIIIYNID